MTTGHHADLQTFLRLCMLELSSQNARAGIWGLRWLGMAFPCLHQLLQILWALVGLSGCCSLLALEVSSEIVGGVEREAKDSCCHTAHNIYHLDLIVAGWPWGVEVWKKMIGELTLTLHVPTWGHLQLGTRAATRHLTEDGVASSWLPSPGVPGVRQFRKGRWGM